MDNTKQIGKNIAAFLLLVALMFPTAIQLLHSCEGHEHIAYEGSSSQIHQEVSDCHICDFHLASFNYDISEYPNFHLPIIPVKIETDLSSLQLHSFITTNTQLRAPPTFS
ncbi:hypothetical protein ESY86_05505 [Subsaximicrobium wynnwilliamsii]|uniref:DUF2946 domain-containing protein n=1 Tax=Subsaximicrobium wynnwilliamsii TaxID=291179 RepID=A0A5C6ZLC4_9FLAO|nr:hypothetical protein [Subsaximicrobium wynnwilliamsii]TXD84515.1 hypothetical protein ESY87_05280 [Subsaximicrobium wynnwilliamsii]TXD90197.1 hypothetical protein ESY86_05505 [Subsaximicrobium wynnwilliamsii]TXE04248.1 hypothetical protein ESY88_05275 [Subsaximicrobium wynnwilliamsii]